MNFFDTKSGDQNRLLGTELDSADGSASVRIEQLSFREEGLIFLALKSAGPGFVENQLLSGDIQLRLSFEKIA